MRNVTRATRRTVRISRHRTTFSCLHPFYRHRPTLPLHRLLPGCRTPATLPTLHRQHGLGDALTRTLRLTRYIPCLYTTAAARRRVCALSTDAHFVSRENARLGFLHYHLTPGSSYTHYIHSLPTPHTRTHCCICICYLLFILFIPHIYTLYRFYTLLPTVAHTLVDVYLDPVWTFVDLRLVYLRYTLPHCSYTLHFTYIPVTQGPFGSRYACYHLPGLRLPLHYFACSAHPAAPVQRLPARLPVPTTSSIYLPLPHGSSATPRTLFWIRLVALCIYVTFTATLYHALPELGQLVTWLLPRDATHGLLTFYATGTASRIAACGSTALTPDVVQALTNIFTALSPATTLHDICRHARRIGAFSHTWRINVTGRRANWLRHALLPPHL